MRIWESNYWKEHCFALTAETLIDQAIELRCIGGVYGNQRPTEFICLLLKLLQLQPEKEILVEYLQVDEFKYLRALAALYIRMTFRAVDVYELLEPLLKDYRKLRQRDIAGYSLIHMDEFVYSLLTEERVCDIILPRIAKRSTLEENGEIGPRKSRLLDAMEGGDDQASYRSRNSNKSSVPSRSRSGPRSPTSSMGSPRSHGSRVSRSPSRSPSQSGSRYRSQSLTSAASYRSRSRSISPDRVDVQI